MQLSKKPLLSAQQIQRRVQQLAIEINSAYQGQSLRVLIVLKGSAIFAADLIRHLKTDLTIDFVRAKSYKGTQSSGNVLFAYSWEEPLTAQHVLLIEDIIDTGHTATRILHLIKEDKPASIAICTLLDKPTHRTEQVDANFIGFDIEDHFVVGYGLDYNERYRQLPDIHILENQ